MCSSSSVLIVSSMPDHRDEVSAAISSSGLLVKCCNTLETAQALVSQHEFSMMFCEGRLSANLREVIREISRSSPPMPVIVISCQDDWKSYLDTLRAGAFDCVVLPAAPGELARIVRTALRKPVQAVV